MSVLTFPTSDGRRTRPGTPLRADPCACDHGPLPDQPADTCIRCGHFEAATIDLTWALRARQLHASERKEAA